MDSELTCALFSWGKAFPSGSPSPLIWVATVGAKSSQMPNLYSALVPGGGGAEEQGQPGVGGSGRGSEPGRGPPRGKVTQKNFFTQSQPKRCREWFISKKPLTCFCEASRTALTLSLGVLPACLIRGQSLPYENGATDPSSEEHALSVESPATERDCASLPFRSHLFTSWREGARKSRPPEAAL